MTSKFKALIDGTPPLSSEENTEGEAPPSEPSVKKDSTRLSTPTSSPTLTPTPPIEIKGLVVSEKNRQHAMLLSVILKQLEIAGLIRRFKVLSAEKHELQEVQVVFDNTYWTEDLDLR